jgi:hypothetical protein
MLVHLSSRTRSQCAISAMAALDDREGFSFHEGKDRISGKVFVIMAWPVATTETSSGPPYDARVAA